jgi:hypothetical protein
MLSSPNLSGATSVLALDGTPTVEKWRMILGTQLEHRPVLDRSDRGRYLSDGLGLKIIRTTTDLKPYSSGEYITPSKDGLLFKTIRDIEGRNPSLISSKQANEQYEQAGAMTYVDEYEHYGNLKGSNQFEYVRLGVVAGSVERGSDEIKRWGALAGVVIETNEEKGMARSYGKFGDAILEGMRESEVLQAIMRFGRAEKNGERGATVYVHTPAIPEWVPVKDRLFEAHLWGSGSGGMGRVLAAIDDCGEWRTSDVFSHPVVSIGREQVIRNLKTLREYGYIGGELKSGHGYRWWDIRASEASPDGHGEFVRSPPT